MKLTFWGAAREVTGSKHLLEVNSAKYMLDCGLHQGHKTEELEKKNREFLVPPSEIKDIILSHAHIDHSGLLPYFVKNGFKGHIYTTPATRDLCNFMLLDSAHIQEVDYQYAVNHNIVEETKFGGPLYTTNDIHPMAERFMIFNYRHEHKLDENVSITFHDAGHVLGSALTEIKVHEKNAEKTILYTGDLGRKGLPILRDPTYITKANYVIIESTYGDRTHDPVADMKDDVMAAVNDAVKRGGKIIIPAFSLERTQEVIYLLHQLEDDKLIPDIPIFVDSPLSYNLTQVFQMHPEGYDLETYQAFLIHQDNPFGFSKLTYVQSVEESKALNDFDGPCIIIASSGMCEAGRIRHHIANNIDNAKNMLLIIGYQAEGSLGRHLVEHAKSVRLFGRELQVRAEIRVLNSFSAHADKNDIMDWLSHVEGLEKVFLVHGEPKQMDTLKEHILAELKVPEVFTPATGESFEV